ncbi:MAG: hypothetical protein HUJ29_02200 [Gammaproteobacteria bacterium]|nr:hypothetical protein [Gammaproteobacteria bacterium]
MQIGSNPGMQAATSLMQSTSQVVKLSAQQTQVSSQNMSEAKTGALQNTAQQMASAVERKGNTIDVMA